MLCVLLILAACSPTGNVVQEETVLIGVNFPLTGTGLSVYGESLLDGLLLGVEHANENIPGKNIQLIVEDNEGKPTKSAIAMRKLTSEDEVHGVVTTMVPIIGPSAPIAEQERIPMLYAAATEKFAEQYTWVFKDSIDAYLDCSELTKEANRRGYSLALFGTLAEFTASCKEGIRDNGGSLIVDAHYMRGDNDFRTQFAKIHNSGADAVFLSGYADDCAIMWQQARELGMETVFLVPFTQTGCGEPNAMAPTEGWDATILGLEFVVDKESKEYQDFVTGFREKYGRDPSLSFFTTLAYDWVHYLKKAFNECDDPADSECVRSALEQVEHTGALGPVHFKENHATFRPRYPIEYIDGAWI